MVCLRVWNRCLLSALQKLTSAKLSHVGGKSFLNLQQMAPEIIRDEVMSATYCEVDQDPVPKCITSVRNVVVLFVALYRMFFKCREPLSFDIPTETDIVRRFPMSAKVFVFTQDGNRT